MNGVKEEFTIKMKQTFKGIWYCDGLQIRSENITVLTSDLDRMMNQVEGVLFKHNMEDTAGKNPLNVKDVTEKWEQKIKNASGTGKED